MREAGPDAWPRCDRCRRANLAWSLCPYRHGRHGFRYQWPLVGLNPTTLGIPDDYPLLKGARVVFGAHLFSRSTTRAGSGTGRMPVRRRRRRRHGFPDDIDGVGGGIIVNGDLGGAAGHFGLIRGPSAGVVPLEGPNIWSLDGTGSFASRIVTAAGVFDHAQKGSLGRSNRLAVSAARGGNVPRHSVDARSRKRIVFQRRHWIGWAISIWSKAILGAAMAGCCLCWCQPNLALGRHRRRRKPCDRFIDNSDNMHRTTKGNSDEIPSISLSAVALLFASVAFAGVSPTRR